jgi:hypothetical protein
VGAAFQPRIGFTDRGWKAAPTINALITSTFRSFQLLRLTCPQANPQGPKFHGAGRIGGIGKNIVLFHDGGIFKPGRPRGV